MGWSARRLSHSLRSSRGRFGHSNGVKARLLLGMSSGTNCTTRATLAKRPSQRCLIWLGFTNVEACQIGTLTPLPRSSNSLAIAPTILNFLHLSSSSMDAMPGQSGYAPGHQSGNTKKDAMPGQSGYAPGQNKETTGSGSRSQQNNKQK
jgi:hypothetical protein